MMEKKLVGKKGEDEACAYLRSIGHTILERNWRWSHLELDIVSLDPAGIHIVEVKSRTLPSPAPPEINVDARKQARLVRAAGAWLSSGNPLASGREVQFDIVTVEFEDGVPSVRYFPQAFIPMYI
jgi:putative endonuclease